MTDIHPVHRKIYDNGFEQGSLITLQTVMAWLDAKGVPIIAEALSIASGDGTLDQFRPDRRRAATPDPLPPEAFEPAPSIRYQQAKSAGYTGNECTYCHGMRMTISGHCEKCEDCGESSGCS